MLAAGYMAMRVLGIGPAATLVTTGVLEERDRLIVADFENRTSDSTLGASVTEAFRIILRDDAVKAVLINIFGGIMRCDVVAEGVVSAAKEVGVEVPVVVRLEGTNVRKGREILQNSGLDFEVAKGMRDAAEKVVAAAGALPGGAG